MKYTFTLSDPEGNLHTTQSLRAFCIENGLLYETLLKKWFDRNTIPVARGACLGWAVISGVLNAKPKKERSRVHLTDYTYINGHHPKAVTWTIKSPSGKIYSSIHLAELCEEHGITNYAIYSKGKTNDTRPILRGPAKGWSFVSKVPVK